MRTLKCTGVLKILWHINVDCFDTHCIWACVLRCVCVHNYDNHDLVSSLHESIVTDHTNVKSVFLFCVCVCMTCIGAAVFMVSWLVFVWDVWRSRVHGVTACACMTGIGGAMFMVLLLVFVIFIGGAEFMVSILVFVWHVLEEQCSWCYCMCLYDRYWRSHIHGETPCVCMTGIEVAMFIVSLHVSVWYVLEELCLWCRCLCLYDRYWRSIVSLLVFVWQVSEEPCSWCHCLCPVTTMWS